MELKTVDYFLFMTFVLLSSRDGGTEGAGGAGGADIGRTVNPITTRGADYAPTLLLATSDFQTLRHP